MEQNMTLEYFYLGCTGEFHTDATRIWLQTQLDLITSLNRAGRRILRSPRDVPRSLWPLVLAKSSDKADVIYFFLREKPDLFKKQTSLGKRKRGGES